MQSSTIGVSEGTCSHNYYNLQCISLIQTLGNPLSIENQLTLSQG